MDTKVTVNVDDLVKPYVRDGSIDITKLASDQNIHVYYTDNIELSGHIKYNADKKSFSIGLNANEPSTRQRFSIAHELSHYMLHKNTIITNGSMGRPTQTAYSKTEQEADKMAAEILMPKYLVNQFLKNEQLADKLNQPNTIRKIADQFNVSQIMAVQRLRELKYNVPYISIA